MPTIEATKTQNEDGTFAYTFNGTPIYKNSKSDFVAVSVYQWEGGALMPAFHKSAGPVAKADTKYGAPRVAIVWFDR